MRLEPRGYDLQVYREVARLALAGDNPYAHPYADFPPLKVVLLCAVELTGGQIGFLVGLSVAYYLSVVTFLTKRYGPDETAIWLGILLCSVPGVYLVHWYQIFEDKPVYVTLMLALLCLIPDFRLRGTERMPKATAGRVSLAGAALGVLLHRSR